MPSGPFGMLQQAGVIVTSDVVHPLTGEPWVRCAVCGGPVQRIYYQPSSFSRRVVFTVGCHGKTEEVQIDYLDVLDAKKIHVGDAFATKQLPAE